MQWNSCSNKIYDRCVKQSWYVDYRILLLFQTILKVLDISGPFSANSEVVIAAPSIHLGTLLQNFRKDIATSAEVCFKITLYNKNRLFILV